MNPLLFVAALSLLPPVATDPGLRPERGFTSERVAMYSTAALDVVSTELALSRGGKEGNPVLGERPNLSALVAVKAGSIAVTELAAHYLRKQGHLGRARFLYWVSAVLWGTAGVLNLRYVW